MLGAVRADYSVLSNIYRLKIALVVDLFPDKPSIQVPVALDLLLYPCHLHSFGLLLLTIGLGLVPIVAKVSWLLTGAGSLGTDGDW